MAVLDLLAAQRLILQSLPAPSLEEVPLEQGRGRYAARSLRALQPIPAFSQSTRDGYALCAADLRIFSDQGLPVTAGIAAGAVFFRRLSPGSAVRIMTGAAVPAGAGLVLPFEDCLEKDGVVSLRPGVIPCPGQFIRKRGAEIARGRIIVARGERIRLDHLPLLVEAGQGLLAVGRRPLIAYFCTGSELVENNACVATGCKASVNRYFVEQMTADAGGLTENFGPVPDSRKDACAAFERALAAKPDIIVSTGGMGPGNFDFVRESFAALGGVVVYDKLQVRPGRATMFGVLGTIPFFGLPGSPPAVRLLFYELVVPALGALQGARQALPRSVRVRLGHEIRQKMLGMLNLRGAVLSWGAEGACARSADRYEAIDAILLLSPCRRRFAAGAMVKAHLL